MRATERLALIAMALLVASFHLWTVRSTQEPWGFGTEQRDYYNLLIDGWLEGQLHLKVEVPPALRALKNPYDPAERPPGLGLHDASYFEGRYYLYFGAAPVVTLMLPFRLVTGRDLPLPVAVLVFVYGGFLAGVAVWRAVQRHYFPECGAAVTVAAVGLIGLAGSGPLLLRRPDMWELPIAAGACFALLMLGCVWQSLHARRGREWWFAAAGLCLGLAIASRPTYLLASPCLLPPLLAWWREEHRVPWRWAGRAALPLAVIGGLMAWHNHARFGSPLEFGQAYQFSLDYESKLPHFGLNYVPFNLRAHFLALADGSRYFPFIAMPDLGPTPPGYTQHRGDVYGVLANFPITWFVLAVPVAWWRRRGGERLVLGAWLAAVALLFGLVAAVMLSFFSSLARYQAEFVPALMLLSLVGLLAFERWRRGLSWKPGRLVLGAVWIAAALVSAVFGVLYSLQYDRLFKDQNPQQQRELARVVNWIPALGEKLVGHEHGPVAFSVRLPVEGRPGAATLLSVGDPPRVDRVILRTRPDGRFQFGVARTGMPEQLGTPLTLDPGAMHRVRVALGSLLPPAAHPYFSGWRDAEIIRAVRQMRVEVNGVTVFSGHGRFLDPVARRARVGARSLGDVAYPRFHGTVTEVTREPLAPGAFAVREPFAGAGDTLRLRVVLPGGPPGQRDPLVVTGVTGAADLLLVEYLVGGRVRFVHDHWGAPLRLSEPVAVDANTPHDLEISLGSLRIVPDVTVAGALPPGRRRVKLDGVVVWDEPADFHPAEAGEIYIGRNPVGGTNGGPEFAGRVLEVSRVARE